MQKMTCVFLLSCRNAAPHAALGLAAAPPVRSAHTPTAKRDFKEVDLKVPESWTDVTPSVFFHSDIFPFASVNTGF